VHFERGTLIENVKLGNEFYLLKIHSPLIAKSSSPGQFVNIRVTEGFHPLLRRPMSIMRREGEVIHLLVKRVGIGTGILSEKGKGEEIDMIGPLGNPFPVMDVILVGGGTGIAPLYFYKTEYGNRVHGFLVGFRTKPPLKLTELLEREGVEISTEDGSMGFGGTVLDFLKTKERKYPLYLCGPKEMIRRASIEFKGVTIFSSLEDIMGCGTGICLGCAVKARKRRGYLRTCRDGPVFKLDEIEL
jgi:dihydroorotate dehydrogenase electron transfer subunit